MILRGSRSSSQPPSRLTASVIEHMLIATLIAIAIVTAIGTIRHSLPGVLYGHGIGSGQHMGVQGSGLQGSGLQGSGVQASGAQDAS